MSDTLDTASQLTSKTEMPIVGTVVVTEMRQGALWPITTLEMREDGSVRVKGDVPRSYGPLLLGIRKVGALMAEMSLLEALRNVATPENCQMGAVSAGYRAEGEVSPTGPDDGCPVTDGGARMGG